MGEVSGPWPPLHEDVKTSTLIITTPTRMASIDDEQSQCHGVEQEKVRLGQYEPNRNVAFHYRDSLGVVASYPPPELRAAH
jgi:hypothetical protein